MVEVQGDTGDGPWGVDGLGGQRKEKLLIVSGSDNEVGDDLR